MDAIHRVTESSDDYSRGVAGLGVLASEVGIRPRPAANPPSPRPSPVHNQASEERVLHRLMRLICPQESERFCAIDPCRNCTEGMPLLDFAEKSSN
jgi:hypothetical protein